MFKRFVSDDGVINVQQRSYLEVHRCMDSSMEKYNSDDIYGVNCHTTVMNIVKLAGTVR